MEGMRMARGDSGRIVIEVDPHLKRQLYSALASDGSTLKAWFVDAASTFLEEREQPRLPVDAPARRSGSEQ